MVDVEVGPLHFNATFDSGNLAAVEEAPSLDGSGREFLLSVSPDCQGTSHENSFRSWFFFSATFAGPPAVPAAPPLRRVKTQQPRRPQGLRCTFTLANLSPTNRIFEHDNRPVFRVAGSPEWQRLPGAVDVRVVDRAGAEVPPSRGETHARDPRLPRRHSRRQRSGAMQVSWSYTFTAHDECVFFAMCYPYSYRQLGGDVDRWQAAADRVPRTLECGGAYLCREVLALSLQQRPVELLTISGRCGMADHTEPPISPFAPVQTAAASPRPAAFPDKKHVLLTARVHPGETPASHVLHGLVEFLLSGDPRAVALRRHFVFTVVPMLNPDGVVLGHYRTDSRGVNLNRVYAEPDLSAHPAIHATRALFEQLASTQRLALYMDLHAHASKRGCFVFANAWDGEAHLENMLLPRLMALNSPHFDFLSCDFSPRSMTSRSRVDLGATKEGTGRVALASEAKLIHAYTFEASYNMSLAFNTVPQLDEPVERGAFLGPGGPRRQGVEVYHDTGRAIAVSLLDQHQINPRSRLPLARLSLSGLRQTLARQMREYFEAETKAGHSMYTTRSAKPATKQATLASAAVRLSLPTLGSTARGARLSLSTVHTM